MQAPDWKTVARDLLELGVSFPYGEPPSSAVLAESKSALSKAWKKPPNARAVRTALWSWRHERAVKRPSCVLVLSEHEGSTMLRVGAWTHRDVLKKAPNAFKLMETGHAHCADAR